MRRVLPLVALGVFLSACGGSESSPAAPTPTTPTVNGLAISGIDAIRTGFFSNYTVTATLSNGTSQTVTPTWSSGNAGVATVASNGDVSGVTNGSVSVTATYQGVTASKTIRVVSNYGGNWIGDYIMRACDQSGAFAGYCAGLGGVGTVLPISLALTQGGNGRDQISGTISLGTIVGNIAGTVTEDGRLVLSGSFTNILSGLTFTFTFGAWDTRLSGSNGMTGRWAQNMTSIGVPGNAYQENELRTMTHTSNAAVPIPAPSNYNLTLQEFLSRMR